MDPSISEYLERLNGLLDVYTNAVESHTAKVDALVVGWATSTPAVVQNPPSPTPSPESTTDASAPVPDVSGSTSKAQEVLEIIHDVPPACVAMAHVTCSTKCAHQVATTDIVNEVRDATATSAPAGISTSPLIHASSTKVQKALDALHGASPGCITMAPLTGSTKCSNQDNGTLVFSPPITTVSLLPAAAPMLVTDLLHSGTDAGDSMQQFRNHDLDVSPPTRHEGLPIRPTPWPSFLVHHSAEGNELRPTPWPSFSCSHEVDLQPALDTTVHVTKDLGPVPDDAIAELTHTVTPTEISPELASLEVCGAGHGVVAIDISVPTASAFTGSLMCPSSNSGSSEPSLTSTHEDAQQMFEQLTRLFDKPEDATADVKEFNDDAQQSRIPLFLHPSIWYEHLNPRGPCFVLLDVQLVFEEHRRPVHLEPRLTWPPLVEANCRELCSIGQFDSAPTVSLFPWNPGGYLLQNSNPMIMVFITASSGSHWHITCIIEESGQCFCHIAKIQWLFHICLKTRMQFPIIYISLNWTMVTDLCNLSVMWYLDHGSLRIKQWWLDIQCLQLVNAIFEAFFWLQRHIFGSSLQVLTTGSPFQMFPSGEVSLFRMGTGAAGYLRGTSDDAEKFSCCFRGSGQEKFDYGEAAVARATRWCFVKVKNWSYWFMLLTASLELCWIQYATTSVGIQRVKNTYTIPASVELCSTDDHFEAVVRDSIDHVVAGLQESYVVVWGEGAAVLTWKINGLSAEYQSDTAQFSTSSLYVATWQKDQKYILNPSVTKTVVYGDAVTYRKSGATPLTAPDIVYGTATELVASNTSSALFNITWQFHVDTGSSYLIRFHFCDIVRKVLNQPYFNTYVRGFVVQHDLDLSEQSVNQLATAIYVDVVLSSNDTSNKLSISISPSTLNIALTDGILDGLEIMKMGGGSGSVFTVGSSGSNKKLPIIIGSVLGVVRVVIIALVVVLLCRRKKADDKQTITESKHEDIQAATYVHKSCDARGVTMPAFNLLSSKILILMLIIQGVRATSGMSFLSCSAQEHFQGGRGVIIVTVVLAKGSIVHEYNLGFDHDGADNDPFINNSLDGVSVGHYYLIEVYLNFGCHRDSDQIKERRALWDPGGSRWRRLGVKPSFKEGGMLGASPTQAHPLDRHMGLAHRTT